MVKLQQKISGSWRTLDGRPQLLRHPQLHLDHEEARRRRARRATPALRRPRLAPGRHLRHERPATPWRQRRAGARRWPLMARQRSERDLDELISEITTDCYNDDEELMGFENAFEKR